MTTKTGKQVHLEEFTHMRLTKQLLVTPSRQNHVTNQKDISTIRVLMATKLSRMATYLDGLLPHKVTWPFDHVVLQDYLTN